jgi:hypothetical protein
MEESAASDCTVIFGRWWLECKPNGSDVFISMPTGVIEK